MLKKIVIGSLAVFLIGALVIGIINAARGRSAPTPSAGQTSTIATNSGTGSVQGQAQGQGQSTNSAPGQGNNSGQGKGVGGQGQTQNPNPGTPQASVTEWITVTGTVNSFGGVGVSLTTDAGAPLWVQFGQSRYVSAQGVAFNVGDHITAHGFYENGQYQAGTVVNDTTGKTLTLRDSTGRPLWAGGNH